MMKTDKPLTWATSFFCMVTKSTVLAILLASIYAASARAAVIGYDLVISPRIGSNNVGTGVFAGGAITGTMFFDESDLSPNGSRQRSNRPGGDTLTIGGVSFDSALNQDLWVFGFSADNPVCIGDRFGNGCGDSQVFGNYQVFFFETDTQSIDFKFSANGTGSISFFNKPVQQAPLPPGTICACFQLANFEIISFDYSFAPQVAVPEPPSITLMFAGLMILGLTFRARRRNPVH